MHRQASYGPLPDDHPINQFLIASNFLFVLCDGGHFATFNIQTGKLQKEISLDSDDLRHVMHPVTYINKLLFYGGKSMQLWNVSEGALIYAFNF